MLKIEVRVIEEPAPGGAPAVLSDVVLPPAGFTAQAIKACCHDAAFGRPQPLRDRLRQRLVDAAVEKGADPIAAGLAVNQLADDRPLLDWLLNGGFAKLLELVMELIKLFG